MIVLASEKSRRSQSLIVVIPARTVNLINKIPTPFPIRFSSFFQFPIRKKHVKSHLNEWQNIPFKHIALYQISSCEQSYNHTIFTYSSIFNLLPHIFLIQMNNKQKIAHTPNAKTTFILTSNSHNLCDYLVSKPHNMDHTRYNIRIDFILSSELLLSYNVFWCAFFPSPCERVIVKDSNGYYYLLCSYVCLNFLAPP